MTIALAWLATRSDGREDLYFASDSRLRGGYTFDLAPKIIMLPRSDSAICFAGDVGWAYPLMLQISNAIGAHRPSRERNLDIDELKGHLLRISTDIVNGVVETMEPFVHSTAQFIFGGYSWRSRGFRLWTFTYQREQKKFTARESKSFVPSLEKVAFVGDWATRLRARMQKELSGSTDRVEHQPLATLAKLLREEQSDNGSTIGGAPQLVRIGPHMNTRPMCVLWGDPKKPTLFGRELLKYENCDYWSIDPDDGTITLPKFP